MFVRVDVQHAFDFRQRQRRAKINKIKKELRKTLGTI